MSCTRAKICVSWLCCFHFAAFAKNEYINEWLANEYSDYREYMKTSTPIEALRTAIKIENMSDIGVSWYDIAKSCKVSVRNKEYSKTIQLLQYGLIDKGYDVNASGYIDKKMIKALKSIYFDIFGVKTKNARLDHLIIEAIASSNKYKNSGSEAFRSVQQYLNREHSNTSDQDYFIGASPCDGVASHNTGRLLTCAFQKEVGISLEDIIKSRASFGPKTVENSKEFLNNFNSKKSKILQCALIINGVLDNFNEKIEFSDIQRFERYFSKNIKRHQRNMYLKQTGKIDLQTLLSLFVSYGDKSRKALACDCATQLSFEQAYALFEAGYRYVGRYLTGVVGAKRLPKWLTRREFEDISKVGLRLFPIYQDGGYNISYFQDDPYNKGMDDAAIAQKAARSIGIPRGTCIYFAIDFDASEEQIRDNIIPYVNGVADNLKGYKIGIYGTRLVCNAIQNAFKNENIRAFVSNLSSNYNGNKGFAMPQNWSFDQFNELSSKDMFDPMRYLPAGLQVDQSRISKFNLDQVVASGLDLGCSI